jgi:hypothetical protein
MTNPALSHGLDLLVFRSNAARRAGSVEKNFCSIYPA